MVIRAIPEHFQCKRSHDSFYPKLQRKPAGRPAGFTDTSRAPTGGRQAAALGCWKIGWALPHGASARGCIPSGQRCPASLQMEHPTKASSIEGVQGFTNESFGDIQPFPRTLLPLAFTAVIHSTFSSRWIKLFRKPNFFTPRLVCFLWFFVCIASLDQGNK